MNELKPPVEPGQGSEALAYWIWDPPLWAKAIILLVGLAAMAYTGYRLYQAELELDLQTHREMQVITATIVGVATATLAMMNLTKQPMLVDVLVGLVCGYGAVLVAQIPWTLDIDVPIAEPHLTVGIWMVIGGAGLYLPTVVNVSGRGIPLVGGRAILVTIAFLLAIQWMLQELSDEPILAMPEIGD